MNEEKITQVDTKQEELNEKNLKEVAGGHPKPGWICGSCKKTFLCPPLNYKCDECGGTVGTN